MIALTISIVMLAVGVVVMHETFSWGYKSGVRDVCSGARSLSPDHVTHVIESMDAASEALKAGNELGG